MTIVIPLWLAVLLSTALALDAICAAILTVLTIQDRRRGRLRLRT